MYIYIYDSYTSWGGISHGQQQEYVTAVCCREGPLEVPSLAVTVLLLQGPADFSMKPWEFTYILA